MLFIYYYLLYSTFAATWITEGDLWLFGGQSYDDIWLRDLWRFNILDQEWFLVYGDTLAVQPSFSGTFY